METTSFADYDDQSLGVECYLSHHDIITDIKLMKLRNEPWSISGLSGYGKIGDIQNLLFFFTTRNNFRK